ncbi:MAG: (d)CMP kinase [Gaiellales bacterium]
MSSPRRVVVTIDGPAGVGKSTVARMVAARLGVQHIDTGAMYRELTAVALERGVSVDDEESLAGLVGDPPPDGVDLRSERVSAAVSAVSRHPMVRERMRQRQREQAGSSAVLEGRDTGTRVCPDAPVKIYLTAPVEVRALRRAPELGLPAEEVERTIAERDRLDAEQLPPSPDAHVIDTGPLSAEQVVDAVLELTGEAA